MLVSPKKDMPITNTAMKTRAQRILRSVKHIHFGNRTSNAGATMRTAPARYAEVPIAIIQVDKIDNCAEAQSVHEISKGASYDETQAEAPRSFSKHARPPQK